MSLSVDGHRASVTVEEGATNHWWIHTLGNSQKLTWISPLPEAGPIRSAKGSLRAPMPGQIRSIAVEIGQPVAEGTVLMILEAMKMEHRIKAPYAGEVKSIHYQVGQAVQADAVLLKLTVSTHE